ncbi:MAG: hypothetical protein V2B15_19675 [Bacteroidota bacterium]
MTPEDQIKSLDGPVCLPEQTELRAGELRLLYENGAIRRIKLGNTEIIRMVYPAVRDRNWETIEPNTESESVTIEETSFGIKLKARYQSGPIDFSADYHISGDSNKIRFSMEGKAQSEFLKNRIGFCVLHPIQECAGKPGRVTHPDGSSSKFFFPGQIAAHQPAKNIQALRWEPGPGIKASLVFSGDIFEMEDQRNWTDASYKTYCTPLGLPFPARMKKGDTISQEVVLFVENESSLLPQAHEFVFSFNPDRLSGLPGLGTSISSRKEPLTPHEARLIKALSFKHLRMELHPCRAEFQRDLIKATRESSLLACPLFVVLYLSEDYQNEYREFVKLCRKLNTDIACLLPIGQNHLGFNPFDSIEPRIRIDFPGVKLGTGVNAYFAELNRNRPSAEKADFVSFTICPQVHATDHTTLVENLEAQAEVVRSAKLLFPGKPIFVSPVSLKQRFNVVATAREPEPGPGSLPPGVDVRQVSVFAAGWTLGSLKFLSQSGADLVSYYETVGWKGFVQEECFPVYKALKEITGYPEVIHSWSSHPLLFDGIMVRSEQETKLFLFNFSPGNLEIRIEPAISPGSISSVLDDRSTGCSNQKFQLRAWDLLVISCGKFPYD